MDAKSLTFHASEESCHNMNSANMTRRNNRQGHRFLRPERFKAARHTGLRIMPAGALILFMKRDMDLVREILMKIEDLPHTCGFHTIAVEGRHKGEISYHVLLLHEAGLIEAQNLTSQDGVDWKPKRLTYAGHEFLEQPAAIPSGRKPRNGCSARPAR